jgi:putative transposase
MARHARIIIPGIPHHVSQRGNGRQQTFFGDDDCALYRDLLKTHAAAHGVAVWSRVLMPDHVHLILVPEYEDSLRATLARVYRAYAGHIHAREQRTGLFWQGRFGCVPMDEAHLMAAISYLALNPVRAQKVKRAEDWQWSSVHAHLDPATGDGLTDTAPVLERVGDFAGLLRSGEDDVLSKSPAPRQKHRTPPGRRGRSWPISNMSSVAMSAPASPIRPATPEHHRLAAIAQHSALEKVAQFRAIARCKRNSRYSRNLQFPAKNPETMLNVDHVPAWAKGGEAPLGYLQTLCAKCIIGKSDQLMSGQNSP